MVIARRRPRLADTSRCRRESAAAIPARLPGCRARALPVREHNPVFTGRVGAPGVELGDGEPVVVGPVAAEQRDTVARHRQGTGAFDVVVPAGYGTVADAHDWEVGVVAGPGARVIDVEGVAVADRVPRADLGIFRVMPGGLQIGGEPDDPISADRFLAISPAPSRSCRRCPRRSSRPRPARCWWPADARSRRRAHAPR